MNLKILIFLIVNVKGEIQAINKNKPGSGLNAGFNDYNLLRLKTNLKPRYCEGMDII